MRFDFQEIMSVILCYVCFDITVQFKTPPFLDVNSAAYGNQPYDVKTNHKAFWCHMRFKGTWNRDYAGNNFLLLFNKLKAVIYQFLSKNECHARSSLLWIHTCIALVILLLTNKFFEKEQLRHWYFNVSTEHINYNLLYVGNLLHLPSNLRVSFYLLVTNNSLHVGYRVKYVSECFLLHNFNQQ